MKFYETDIWGFNHALRGMRNPKNSWDKSDTRYLSDGTLYIGPNDFSLAKSLIKAGTSHRKFLRQIFVSVDIIAPLYWWKEFDTYKVSTVANSCSTMHTLSYTPITVDCFEKSVTDNYSSAFRSYVDHLESIRIKYNETKDPDIWKTLIAMLPESWLQKRTVTMDYETIRSIVEQRKNHKLKEWSVDFMAWARSLPFADAFIFDEEHII